MRIESSSGLRSMVITGGALIASALLAISPTQESDTYASQFETPCAKEIDRSMTIAAPVVGSTGALGGFNASWIITVQTLSESCQSELPKIAITSGGSLVDTTDGVSLTASEGSPSFFEARLHASGKPMSSMANGFSCSDKPSDLDLVVLGTSEEITRKKLWIRDSSSPALTDCNLPLETSLTSIN